MKATPRPPQSISNASGRRSVSIPFHDTEGTVELDRVETWPKAIRTGLEEYLKHLMAERMAERRFELSGDRWHKPWPEKPTTRLITDLINRSMAGSFLRVFHATRLFDYEEVRTHGLRLLNITERLEALKRLIGGPLSPMADSIEEMLTKTNWASNRFGQREGLVWGTPLRRSLYDGGCDVFFENWGGEAVQRLAEASSTKLAAAIQTIGVPAVVVFRIPAFGFCEASDLRLAPTMIELAIERESASDVSVGSWDVRARAAVPPEWIDAVLPPHHPYLTSFGEGATP